MTNWNNSSDEIGSYSDVRSVRCCRPAMPDCSQSIGCFRCVPNTRLLLNKRGDCMTYTCLMNGTVSDATVFCSQPPWANYILFGVILMAIAWLAFGVYLNRE